jgi:hypothetical protein
MKLQYSDGVDFIRKNGSSPTPNASTPPLRALKSAGVPVIWVGLASQHGTKSRAKTHFTLTGSIAAGLRRRASSAPTFGRASSMNRAATRREVRTTKAKIRQLRTGDGVYFTKFGARKLAHYVEREVQCIVGNKGLPVALRIPVDPAPQATIAKRNGPAERGSWAGRAGHDHARRCRRSALPATASRGWRSCPRFPTVRDRGTARYYRAGFR